MKIKRDNTDFKSDRAGAVEDVCLPLPKTNKLLFFPKVGLYPEPFGREDITMISLRQNPLDASDIWGILFLDDRIMFRGIGD